MDPYALRAEVEEFLYHESELLDRWELDAWLGLFVEDCEYSIPPTDLPDADPTRHTFLVHDDRFLLSQRVKQLQRKTHSRMRRLVTNVRAVESEDGIDVAANFAVYRMRYEAVDVYVGTYRHRLVRDEGGQLRFQRRKAILDLDALRPQTKVSIIL